MEDFKGTEFAKAYQQFRLFFKIFIRSERLVLTPSLLIFEVLIIYL
jgi:hypothetical protein